MTSLNVLDLVPAALEAKYMPDVKKAFTATQDDARQADLARIQADFTQDGGTALQWDALTHCARYPR